MKQKKIVVGVLFGFWAIIAAGAGGAIGYRMGHSASGTNIFDDTPYTLLARRILIDNPNDTIINFSPLRDRVREYVTQANVKVSFFFEYLPTGTSINIGDQQQLIAASLMKTPLVMNLYRAKELGRIDLDTKVPIKQEWINDEYGPLYEKGAGTVLTLRDYVKYTLIDSDNTAANAVFASTGDKLTADEQSLNAIDIHYQQDESQRALVTAESYSSILKCLYFSCYLDKSDSQEILNYLTESPYKNRLAAGLPEGMLLAHKIGTFSTLIQSDCGIVYIPKRNYSICVMIAGAEEQADGQIRDLSKIVYDFVSKQSTSGANQ